MSNQFDHNNLGATEVSSVDETVTPSKPASKNVRSKKRIRKYCQRLVKDKKIAWLLAKAVSCKDTKAVLQAIALEAVS